jgi:hypothetical protein
MQLPPVWTIEALLAREKFTGYKYGLKRSASILAYPSYTKVHEWIAKQLAEKTEKFAVLTRADFLHNAKHYWRFFRNPPTTIYMIVERLNLPTGQCDFFAHVWLVWERGQLRTTNGTTQFGWIPPGYKR